MEKVFPWCLIPPQIAYRDDLSPDHKLAYGVLLGAMPQFITPDNLAKFSGLRLNLIETIVKDLMDKNLIQISLGGIKVRWPIIKT